MRRLECTVQQEAACCYLLSSLCLGLLLLALNSTQPLRTRSIGSVSAVTATETTTTETTTTETTTSATTTSANPRVDMGRALACLRLTKPSLKLVYPNDAEAHFAKINEELAQWQRGVRYHCAAGYCGPWMENHWMEHCNKLLRNRAKGKRLSDIFGPYIPILVQFVDLWATEEVQYEYLIRTLRRILRPSVAYVALVQHADGLMALRSSLKDVMRWLPNVLVLSGGGYGHVPVPLFKQLEPLNTFAKPMAKRGLLISYMGSTLNAPRSMRRHMIETLNKTAAVMGIKERVYVGKSDSITWHKVMGNSRVSLCPRGFGRTSYHVMETLQMGHVPVHVYMDIPWVPYAKLFSSFGFVTTVKGLPQLMRRLNQTNTSQLEAMEVKVRAVRKSHFTWDGMLEQVFRFLTGKDGGGDLRCQKLPNTSRDQ